MRYAPKGSIETRVQAVALRTPGLPAHVIARRLDAVRHSVEGALRRLVQQGLLEQRRITDPENFFVGELAYYPKETHDARIAD